LSLSFETWFFEFNLSSQFSGAITMSIDVRPNSQSPPSIEEEPPSTPTSAPGSLVGPLLFLLLGVSIFLHENLKATSFLHLQPALLHSTLRCSLSLSRINPNQPIVVPRADVRSTDGVEWFPGALPIFQLAVAPNLTFIPEGPTFKQSTFRSCPLERAVPRYTTFHDAIAVPGTTIVVTPDFVYQARQGMRQGSVGALPRSLYVSPRDRVESAVFFAHWYPHCFSHLLNEVLPGFLAIPEAVWQRSVFFVPRSTLKTVVYDILVLCDRRPLAIKNHWRPIFARSLHMPLPWYFMEIYPMAVRAMRHLVLRKLNWLDLIPRNFIVLQRKKNRMIFNYEAFVAAARNAYPKENWVAVNAVPPSFVEQIRIHANATMMVFVSGSGGANAVWMRPKAVFIEIQVRDCVSSLMQVAKAVGLKVFETLSNQRNRVTIVVNITFMLGIIQRGHEWLQQNDL
jgi:hypothetical protein